MQVHEVMTKNVKIVSPTAKIDKAASLMGEIDCGALPAGENDRLVGMITDRDITLRAVAKGRVPAQCTVREAMSPDIKYVFEDETTDTATQNMSSLHSRDLPVLNLHHP